MAYRFLEQALESGVTVDPRDFNLNADALAQEANGFIDRDNVQTGAVTAAKCKVQALTAVAQNPRGDIATPTDVQVLSAGTGAWTEIADMRTTATVSEGELIVDADLNIVCGSVPDPLNATPSNKWIAMLTIDGIPVAHSGWVHFMRVWTGVSLTGSAPVRSGTSVIAVFVKLYRDPSLHLSDLLNGVTPGGYAYTDNPMTTAGATVKTGNVVYVNRRR